MFIAGDFIYTKIGINRYIVECKYPNMGVSVQEGF